MSVLKFEDQNLPDFYSDAARDEYAALVESYIPGRRAIFSIVEAAFRESLHGRSARILVVGAGGGDEILRLGQDNPSWTFVGIDTYEPMVDLARRRIAGTPVEGRSVVHARTIADLDETGFDAATCILTAHFVPDDGSKFEFFQAMYARLKPGAPLAIVDGVGVSGEPHTEMLRRIWKQHALDNGVDEQAAEHNAENMKKVAIVSVEREEQLLTSAGFKELVPIFRALAIKGWLALA